MQFAYRATTKSGETISGALDAPDKFFAARLLRRDGYTPLSVREAAPAAPTIVGAAKRLGNIFQTVGLQERVIFAKNLAGMLSAGLSLARGLMVLEKQTSNPFFKKVLAGLGGEITRGGSLSAGLEKFPKVFSALFTSMVRAGEESGTLARALKEISVHLERSYALRRKIRGAMTYPMVIIIAMLVIGVLMFIFVVPTLVQVFRDLSVNLPWSTRLIISASNFLKFNTAVFFGVLAAVGLGLFFLVRLRAVKILWDGLILRLPVISVIAKQINSARTARTLSTLIASGVAIVRAIGITKEVVQNVHYRKILDAGIAAVEKGQTLSGAFKAGKLYPEMLSEMMEVGEETGKLSQMLAEAADFYEAEVDAKTKNLSTIIEPVLMIFIGAAVGFFAVSMLTPIYSILQNI